MNNHKKKGSINGKASKKYLFVIPLRIMKARNYVHNLVNSIEINQMQQFMSTNYVDKL